jgi:F-type H+-transporting ATPase subunit alpha
VLSTGDGIARIYGLQRLRRGRAARVRGRLYGMVLNLEEDNVGAAIFADPELVTEGSEVRRTGRIVEVPVGGCAARPRAERARSAHRRARALSTRRSIGASR